MSWRQELDAILPPDKADSAPITHHLRGLLESLHNGQGDRPRITITLEQDAWSMLESQFRRPYRPHSSYMLVPLDVGAVAFERRKEAPPEGPLRPAVVAVPEGMTLEEAQRTGKAETLRHPVFAEGCVGVKWDAAAIEAKAASLSTGAIYSAPMAEPMVEGGKVVDVAVYGGPWKESK